MLRAEKSEARGGTGGELRGQGDGGESGSGRTEGVGEAAGGGENHSARSGGEC